MNAHGHSQEPTDDSVLSHEGLADLVHLDRGSRVWHDTRALERGGGETEEHRSSRDGLHPQESEPTRGNSFLPSSSFPRSPPPALFHSSQIFTSTRYGSLHSQSAPSHPPSLSRSSLPSLDFPPPQSFRKSYDPYSSAAPIGPTLHSASTASYQTDAQSFHERRGGDRGWGSEEENKLEWVPSLDSEFQHSHEFDGLGGAYQHGVGYEREITASNGKKGKISEAKLASRIKKLEQKFVDNCPTLQNREASGRSIKEGMKAMKEELRREKMEQRQRSGIDEKGRLLVAGVKKRNTMRWFQGVGAIVIAIASIGASVLAKPKEKPPPSGTIPLIILYIFPFVSFLITIYLFVLRPCLFASRLRKAANSSENALQRFSGSYPLVQGHQSIHESSNWCSCLGGGRSRVPRGGSQQAYQPTSINLIVDPSWFSQQTKSQTIVPRGQVEERQRRRRKANRRKRRQRTSRAEKQQRAAKDSDVETDLLSSSSSISSLSDSDIEVDTSYSSTNPRSFSSILSHVALEERWLAARKQVKWNATVDFLTGTLWGGVGVWAIGFNGKKCPMGGFEGYCNLYNTALAFSILLSIAFFTSFAFDCLDLSRAKVSPRHRQQRLTAFDQRGERKRRVRIPAGIV
ncbi:hypothetical protein JCM3765_003582 [Sporobolomyces pararoseus]